MARGPQLHDFLLAIGDGGARGFFLVEAAALKFIPQGQDRCLKLPYLTPRSRVGGASARLLFPTPPMGAHSNGR